ncbi:OPT/YSL family transporter [bacterium]|nr:OPT/YSL family transporter [bacterium]MCI0604560.1 OPT/YSL family transporter [bacterium]
MTNDSPSLSKGTEFSLRSVVVGAVVAIITGLAYPYIVLKLGFGPNISVVAAFFGFIALVLILRARDTNPRENNIVQTMGTSAGQTAFMCVLLAAFDMLNERGVFNPPIHLDTAQIFFWLCSASLLGVLLAVPMRQHYIDEENLTYADGLAAGETIAVLHETKEKGARGPTMALTLGGIASAALMLIVSAWKLFRDTIYFGAGMQAMRVGFSWSLLSFGSGLLVGWRICLAMAIGMITSWFLLPQFLFSSGLIPAKTFPETLRWVMWPATGLMVAGGLTSLFLKWHLIVKTFKTLRGAKVSDRDFPIRWVVIGSILLTAILCVTQYFSLGIPLWVSLLSIILSLPLMLVGLRVLGETNWGPISAMSNMMQAIFAVISPGNVAVNMSSSGLTGTIAVQSEALMQDYRAGAIVGSNNRLLTYAQLIAAPIGAAATAFIYPVLRAKFGVGADGLSSPISVKWAGFAELLTQGLNALPPGCLIGLLFGVVAGIILTFLAEKFGQNVPSPSAMGIGMLIPADVLMPFMLGGLAQFIWSKTSPKQEDEYRIPLASGLIAGEALIAVALSIYGAVTS